MKSFKLFKAEEINGRILNLPDFRRGKENKV